MSSDELTGKTALVTGATSGIGRATAVLLAQKGATVLVHGRNAARGAEVVEEIAKVGGRARFIQGDLADPADVKRVAQEAGDIDILVNNAGTAWFGPTPDIKLADLDALFDSNVRATYLLTAALIPGFVRRGGGSIVNVSSMAGKIGMAGGAAYGATKAAVASLTQAWAAEYAKDGIRSNAVAPGPIYTPAQVAEQTEALGKSTPLARAGRSEEIAESIAFLASDRASYITGAILSADGGYTAI
jgi:NAD(P)-dependent dehydrogenase (short-subunit alcohol dehydrogenase family)